MITSVFSLVKNAFMHVMGTSIVLIAVILSYFKLFHFFTYKKSVRKIKLHVRTEMNTEQCCKTRVGSGCGKRAKISQHQALMVTNMNFPSETSARIFQLGTLGKYPCQIKKSSFSNSAWLWYCSSR